MALTVTARGTGTHNVSSTTFTLSPASNLAVGSLAVLVVSADNAAASGIAFTTFSVSDTNGNIWTRRVTPLYDPGAADAGVTGAQFTTDMAGGVLTTSTVITVRFDTATTAKAWVLWEVIPATMKVVSYIASDVNAGAATTTPTVTTASLTSGDVVIGGLHNEYGTAQTVTADADTTNGTWSAQQTTEIGTTTAGMSVASQAKVVSGTATQTYNPTLGTSSDVILSWIQLREIPFLKVGAVDQTSFALLDSMRLSLNTFDFALKDPATIPALGDAVTVGLPVWAGTVASVTTTDATLTYGIVTVTATNEDEAFASAAPFGLSDAPSGATSYVSVATATVPVGWWRLGEPSGTVATDVMGVTNGTYVNTPTLGATGLLTGDADTAVTFNGSNEWITVADSATLNCFEGTNPWTFAVWVSHTRDANQRHILNITDEATGWVTIASDNSGLLAWRHGAGGDDQIFASALSAATHLVVVTYSGTAMAVYVDGALAGGGTNPLASTRSLPTFTGSLHIGADGWFGGNGFGTPFNGTLDEPALWNRALSGAEVAALYTAGTTAPSLSPTYGFKDMSVRTVTNLDATTETTGSCTIFHAGLWPAMTFELTSANRGYSAQSFSVTNTTVTWPKLTNPVFRIEFGDPLVTMSVWLASLQSLPADGTITQTMITDGAVTTPKLAANAVTAAKITAGTITATELAAASVSTDKLTIAGRTFASLVPNYSFEDSTGSAVPLLWTSSVVGTGVVTSTTGGQHGSRILSLYSTSGSPNRADANGTLFPVTASQLYYISSWRFNNPGSTTGAYLRISWYDNTLAALSDSDLIANGATVFAWTRFEGYVTAPASAAFAQVVLINYQPATTGTLVWDEIVMLPYAAGVKNSTAEVVIDAAGITVTEGAITVTNAGATVIIDGTSDMFRISTSGSLSVAAGTGAFTSTTTVLSGLGTYSATPAQLSYLSASSSATGGRILSNYILLPAGVGYVAGSSGGSPTNPAITPTLTGRAYTFVNGSNYCVIQLDNNNANVGSTTLYCTYYILAQSAI